MASRSTGAERIASTLLRGTVRPVLVLAAAATVLFLVAHPRLWSAGADGSLAVPGGVLLDRVWADLSLARGSVAEGSLPLWNPWDRGGQPFFAEPSTGMFDPVTWLVVLLGVVIGAMPLELALAKIVLHYAIAGAGFAAFFRARRLPGWVVAFGTVAVLWAPRVDALKDHPGLWPVAWVGWVMLALERLLDDPTPRRGLWLGAALGLMLGAGDPPTAAALSVLLVPWALVRIGARTGLSTRLLDRLGRSAPEADEPDAEPRRVGIAVGIAVAVALAWAAGALWTTDAALAADDPEGLGALRFADAWIVITGAGEAPQLLLYAGVSSAAAALIAIVARGRAEPIAWVVVAILAFATTVGGEANAVAGFVAAVGLAPLLPPSAALTVFVLGLVLAATFGMGQLVRLKGESRWVAVLGAGFCLSGFFTHGSPEGTSVLVVLASVAVVIALGFASPLRQRQLGWAAVAVLAWDLWGASRPIAEDLVPPPEFDRDKPLLAALGDGDTRDVARIASFGYTAPRIGPRAGVRDIGGEPSARSGVRFEELHDLAQHVSNILRAMNVSVVAFSGRVSGSELTRDLRPIRGERGLFTVEGTWPLAFWTDRVAVVDKRPEARVWLRMQRDPAAVLERPWLPDGFDATHWGSHLRDESRPDPRWHAAELLVQRPDRLELRIDAPRPGLLVAVEAFDEGWQAEVDGEPADVLRTNVIFRAIPIEAGTHEVVLRYRPAGVVPLWVLWVVMVIGTTATAVAAARRHGRRGPVASPPEPETGQSEPPSS